MTRSITSQYATASACCAGAVLWALAAVAAENANPEAGSDTRYRVVDPHPVIAPYTARLHSGTLGSVPTKELFEDLWRYSSEDPELRSLSL